MRGPYLHLAKIISVALSVFVSLPSQAADVFFQKNGWRGVVLGSDRAFQGCVAHANLSEQISFGIAQFRNSRWVAVFMRPEGFQRHMRWDMELLVDGRSIHRGTAVVDGSGLAILEPALTALAVTALSSGHNLEVVTIKGRFQYSLAGSADAIEAAAKCVAYYTNTNQQTETGAISKPDEPRIASGTGFFVSSDGRILTNSHVVNGCSAVSVGRPGSTLQPATVIARDTKNDLALLSSQLKPERVATMRTNVRLGENVAVYGFPLAGILPSTGNFTLGNIAATAGLRDDTRMLQISAPVQLGNSGGPLLDQDANVVGVVVGKLNALAAAEALADIPQNINFAIKSVVATTFLEANGIQPSHSSATGAGLQPPDVADRAKAMTALIVCRK